MAQISQTDLTVRLQIFGIKYTDVLSEWIDALRYGKQSSLYLENDLFNINMIIEILKGFDVGNTTGNNCFTEDQLSLMLDNFSEKYNICFQPYGFNYKPTNN